MKKKGNKEPDSDLAHSAAALRRAAQQARLNAERTHTPFVTYENGTVKRQMVVRETPDEGR